jgi:hypothetical protein
VSNKKTIDNEASLIRIIRVLAGLSLGVMAAFLASIQQITPELKLRFSFMTVVAFLLALVFSMLFWRIVFVPETSAVGEAGGPVATRRRAVKFTVLSAILCFATLAAFGISLKGIGNERIRDVIQGAAIAVIAVSFLGFVLWRLGRFLERDSNRSQHIDEQSSKQR